MGFVVPFSEGGCSFRLLLLVIKIKMVREEIVLDIDRKQMICLRLSNEHECQSLFQSDSFVDQA